MRIVTRPDFDGIVCAVLLSDKENVSEPVKWVEPHEIQQGMVEIKEGDIMANLPYDNRCSMWFDHHFSNRIEKPFSGSFMIAPSAAGVVFSYYKGKFKKDYNELVKETDKIDSAQLSMDEVSHPEKYLYILLSMTISNHSLSDEAYWNRLIHLLKDYDISGVMSDSEVKIKCEKVIKNNRTYKSVLTENTILNKHVAITDLRLFDDAPEGNRFLVYSLYPEAAVSVKIRYDDISKDKIAVSIGHNIFNPNCRVNVGRMLIKFGGGGHRGAGACRFSAKKAEEYIPEIISILLKNESND
ncbi:MAG: exopolyphosphatase [Proteobacteria bacterium]|nr:exopolyphosphatase [Pseudomonadota bacterium]MBU4011459.1 exopolyphosphatase [Pseudomonadota bacterium]MBU4037169.1 exopolyphosphatase [Pseudomonadota bacterium]